MDASIDTARDGDGLDARTEAAVEALGALIGFDTTSRHSNLALVEWLEARLAAQDIPSRRIHDETGAKANLIATVGPTGTAGYVLSGHTDVVPVDGQSWSSDPFAAEVGGGRVTGRGATDMKGFLACMIASVPAMRAAGLKRPIHLVFSYDEEVGCVGVRPALRDMAAWSPRPLGCVVGEPTRMGVVVGHKAKRSMRAIVRGTTGHSSLAPRFVNAVAYAARLVAEIHRLAAAFEAEGARDAAYDVPFTTLHVGRIAGGEALNIVPDRCVLEFEVRAIGADDPDAAVARVLAFARETLEPEMRRIAPGAGIDFEEISRIDGLDTDPEAEVVTLAKACAGRNEHSKVAFGTEGGFFASIAGVPAVVCGPGDIADAHQPDEGIDVAELTRCLAFIDRLIAHCADG